LKISGILPVFGQPLNLSPQIKMVTGVPKTFQEAGYKSDSRHIISFLEGELRHFYGEPGEFGPAPPVNWAWFILPGKLLYKIPALYRQIR
jgi:hypothetical protein